MKLMATTWLLIEKNAQIKTPQSLERGVYIGGKESTKQYFEILYLKHSTELKFQMCPHLCPHLKYIGL
jgi:hypothetical protein